MSELVSILAVVYQYVCGISLYVVAGHNSKGTTMNKS